MGKAVSITLFTNDDPINLALKIYCSETRDLIKLTIAHTHTHTHIHESYLKNAMSLLPHPCFWPNKLRSEFAAGKIREAILLARPYQLHCLHYLTNLAFKMIL